MGEIELWLTRELDVSKLVKVKRYDGSKHLIEAFNHRYVGISEVCGLYDEVDCNERKTQYLNQVVDEDFNPVFYGSLAGSNCPNMDKPSVNFKKKDVPEVYQGLVDEFMFVNRYVETESEEKASRLSGNYSKRSAKGYVFFDVLSKVDIYVWGKKLRHVKKLYKKIFKKVKD